MFGENENESKKSTSAPSHDKEDEFKMVFCDQKGIFFQTNHISK